jgi:hypothetical protein
MRSEFTKVYKDEVAQFQTYQSSQLSQPPNYHQMRQSKESSKRNSLGGYHQHH